MDKDLLEILKFLAEDLTILIRLLIVEKSGKDSGKPIQEGGSFLKNTYFTVDNNGSIKLVIPDQVIRPNQLKIKAIYLANWIKRKGIIPREGRTVNQLAFAISNSIYKKGLSSGIFNDWITDGQISEYAAEQLTGYLEQKIIDDFVKAFSKS
jgi:hypothetical protein